MSLSNGVRFFAREKQKKKEFLLEALEFLKEKNLYIEKQGDKQ